ncbi:MULTISPECIES: hypothetical protein [unclassified Arthrobacter]|uniref:hypothetical protein n=1 Tax=unclassified Arthrobacter TaxID=235627 RepID=UPI001D1464C1|nr:MULTISPECIES: hypothetical protein [unclassified Arthrobacter]MCC3289940.1 hypothetical protein [Arthrobacter sp. zg-Y1110]MCC3300548.1 hypothetical protein [Arthrobacter sp. zg-Y895]UWX84653.1 hypothetical protein N2K99_14495 [Arthrobacter sp. zg-Y1110]
MDSPPLIAYILFGAGAVVIGPAAMVMGIRAHTGRWTSWLGLRVSTGSTAKHSRVGFTCFWGGLAFTGTLLAMILGLLGMPLEAVQLMAGASWCIGMPIAMMHHYFLPKALRPVLLPQWYRDWEADQFEFEARNEERRRARRARKRDKRRREKEKARLLQAKAAAREEKRRARMQQAAP